jgi:hypothetical protein
VVLKLYALPFLAWFLLTRRFRAAVGMACATLILLGLGVLGLGLEVHRAFGQEVLPWALRGLVQDPYSPIWGSLTSLAYRLFRFEPDLNPLPLADWPGVARALAAGLPVAFLVAALAWAAPSRDPKDLRAQWALLMIASLVASPLTASYHFVLLILPAALLAADALERGEAFRAALFLAALAFVGSPLPHYGFRFLGGWGSLLAYSRLYVLVALFAIAAAPLVTRAGLALAVAAGLLAGGLAARAPAELETGERRSHGYSASQPIDCGRERGFTAVRGPRMVGETLDGRTLEPAGPALSLHCEAGAVVAGPPRAAADEDAAGGMRVEADRTQGVLTAWSGDGGRRILANGRVRHPRVRADGEFALAEYWEGGSWDIRVFDLRSGLSRLVAGGPSNEQDPEWTDGGSAVLFASDRGRGLRSTAVYRVAFRER